MKKTGRVLFEDKDFTKSSHSGNWGGVPICVQVARKEGKVGVRDSKDHRKTTLVFTNEEWQAFLKGVRGGEFDV